MRHTKAFKKLTGLGNRFVNKRRFEKKGIGKTAKTVPLNRLRIITHAVLGYLTIIN